jgi:6-phosphogluconolactonase
LFSFITTEYPKALDWKRIHFFWVDERCVPFSSDESNFGVADRLLFSKIDIPRKNLHPIHGDNDPANEADRYAGELLAHVPVSEGYPVFDVVLLGMGNDGHTASIFPGHDDLFETSSVCSVSSHPQSGQKRVTLTGRVINNARKIVFLITGSAKAHLIKSIFEDMPEAGNYPAKKINPVNGWLSWYFDNDAAVYIKGNI